MEALVRSGLSLVSASRVFIRLAESSVPAWLSVVFAVLPSPVLSVALESVVLPVLSASSVVPPAPSASLSVLPVLLFALPSLPVVVSEESVESVGVVTSVLCDEEFAGVADTVKGAIVNAIANAIVSAINLFFIKSDPFLLLYSHTS